MKKLKLVVMYNIGKTLSRDELRKVFGSDNYIDSNGSIVLVIEKLQKRMHWKTSWRYMLQRTRELPIRYFYEEHILFKY